MIDAYNLHCFLSVIGQLLDTPEVQSMAQWRHHFDVTCYEHSLFVSYIAFRLARFFRMDCYAAARAGLLHDLYLYSPYDPTSHPGNQCFYHPVAALHNAKALVPDLSPEEQNSILTHMWPLAAHMPKCRLAIIINLSDKFCATLEVLKLYHLLRVRDVMPASTYCSM